MHLDVEQIERLAAGELAPAHEAPLRAHVAACPHCGRRVEQARREEAEVLQLLRRLDHPVPAIRAGAIAARASARRPAGWMRIAAAVVLTLLAAGAVYAISGSPLRGWLREAGGWLAPSDPSPRDPSLPAPGPSPRPPADAGAGAGAGVAVDPGADFTIVFAAPQQAGTATVRLVDAPMATVRVLGAAVPFDVGDDRVTIASAGSTADYEILLPRAAPRVRIQLGGVTVLRKEGARITTAAAPGADGAYHLSLRPPG